MFIKLADRIIRIETMFPYIAERMPLFDTILFHDSAIDGEGYLFTAKSGTGKSTHTRLWREILANREAMVQTLGLLDRLSVKLYRLACNMDICAAELAYHTMGGFS